MGGTAGPQRRDLLREAGRGFETAIVDGRAPAPTGATHVGRREPPSPRRVAPAGKA